MTETIRADKEHKFCEYYDKGTCLAHYFQALRLKIEGKELPKCNYDISNVIEVNGNYEINGCVDFGIIMNKPENKHFIKGLKQIWENLEKKIGGG